MNLDTIPRMACRTCGVPLNRYADLVSGQVEYTHPLGVVLEPAGHDPDPAPLDEVDARHVCDFCSDERIAFTLRTVPISSVADTPDGRIVERYGTDWSACFVCAGYLQARDLDGLGRRLRQVGPRLDRIASGAARVMQQAVLQSLLPGVSVAAIGRWPATALPAAISPPRTWAPTRTAPRTPAPAWRSWAGPRRSPPPASRSNTSISTRSPATGSAPRSAACPPTGTSRC
jgi:hypothetical protein